MIDKIMQLIEDNTYTFKLVINDVEHEFTKEGKQDVHNFLNAFKKTIDLEQVYFMRGGEPIAPTEPTEVSESEASEVEEENIIKPKKNKSKNNVDSL